MIKNLLISVCAWCPDKAAREAAARQRGHDVTHGICPACYAREMAALFPAPRRLVELTPERDPSRTPVRTVCRLRSRAELSPV